MPGDDSSGNISVEGVVEAASYPVQGTADIVRILTD